MSTPTLPVGLRLRILGPKGTPDTRTVFFPESLTPWGGRKPLRIGNRLGVELYVDDPAVSSLEAVVEWTDHGLVLRRIAAEGAVRLNGEPVVEAAPLRVVGDRIQVGDTTMTVEVYLYGFVGSVHQNDAPQAPSAAPEPPKQTRTVRVLTRIVLHVTEPGVPPYDRTFDRTEKGSRPGVTIGRGERSKLRVADPAVARMHAVIELSTQGAKLIDYGSCSLVNGIAVNTAELKTEDVIAMGATSIRVTELRTDPFEVPVETQAPEPRPEAPPPPMPTKTPPTAPTARVEVSYLQAFLWTLDGVAKHLLAKAVRYARSVEASHPESKP